MEKVIALINNTKKSNMSIELKEDMIEEYCRKKGYCIEFSKHIGYFTAFDLMDMITDVSFIRDDMINKVIVISADELTIDYDKLFAISTALNELDILIESITDGVIGKDMTFQLNVDKGDEN